MTLEVKLARDGYGVGCKLDVDSVKGLDLKPVLKQLDQDLKDYFESRRSQRTAGDND